MPEGHVSHRLAETITAEFGGSGRTLRAGTAYGKHLIVAFDGIDELTCIGLAGKLTFGSGAPPSPVGTVRWRWWRARR